MAFQKDSSIQIILGNSNPRFSGVTSTMLQVLEQQKNLARVAVLGKHNLPADIATLTFWQMIKLCRTPTPHGQYRVFHARRNDEVIQALVAKRLFGAKIKIAFTSTAQRYHSRFTRWLLRQVDGIISTGDAAGSYLVERPADIIIPHGVDSSFYYPPASKQQAWKELGLPGSFGIGIFGRIRESKGTDILVDAAIPALQKFPEATVVICGKCLPKDEAFQQQLQDRIDSAGLSERFIFLGERPFNEIPALFRAMTIVTALSRNEGFGLTPLEAMASGCAVLTSEAGAWKEIFQQNVEGLRVPTGDVAATTVALEKLLANIELTTTMGINGRKAVEEYYNIEREAKEITSYLLSL